MTTVRVPEDFPTLEAALASPVVKSGDEVLVKKGMSEDPVVVPFEKDGIRVSGYGGEPEGDTGGGENDVRPDTDTVTGDVEAGGTPAGVAPDPVAAGDEAIGDENAGALADDGPDRGEEPEEEGMEPESGAETQRFEESGGGWAEGPQEPEAEKAQTRLFGHHPRPVATVAGPVTRFIRVGQGSTSSPKIVIRRRF